MIQNRLISFMHKGLKNQQSFHLKLISGANKRLTSFCYSKFYFTVKSFGILFCIFSEIRQEKNEKLKKFINYSMSLRINLIFYLILILILILIYVRLDFGAKTNASKDEITIDFIKNRDGNACIMYPGMIFGPSPTRPGVIDWCVQQHILGTEFEGMKPYPPNYVTTWIHSADLGECYVQAARKKIKVCKLR